MKFSDFTQFFGVKSPVEDTVIIKPAEQKLKDEIGSPDQSELDFISSGPRIGPYLEWGSQVVLLREHLLIGRARPRISSHLGGDLGVVRECYNHADDRPTIRFLSKHQLVIPPTIPEPELTGYSRHHALVLYTPTDPTVLHIIDARSQAGVWVNGKKIKVFPSSAETLRDDPRTLEEALKFSEPLTHEDTIHLCDPCKFPRFYLTVYTEAQPVGRPVRSHSVEDRTYSFLE